MKFNNMADLRDTLARMETQQLDEMLLEELRKESPNGDLIRLIGRVLKERDRDVIPTIDANIQQAWEQYQAKAQPVHKKPKSMNSFLLKAASLILVLFALVAILPQEAKAMNFFERFIAWTEDVFSLISPAEDGEHGDAYIFQTENPGLQEVYDEVTELGITIPVVPTWIPEEYELVELKVNNTPARSYLFASFFDGKSEMVYQVNRYSDNVTHEYYKGDLGMQEVELNDVTFQIFQNKDLWVAVWTEDKIECSIFIDCQEDVLNQILKSIYTMEEK